MKITQDTVASFHYELKEGESTLETSREGDPVLYLHGYQNLLPAMEKQLEGQEAGAKISMTLTPAEAYGERQDGATQRIPIKHLVDHAKLKNKLRPGMTASVNTEHGPQDAVVLKVGRFNIDIDANHPYAGKTLTFDIEVLEVRKATAEEVSHGHAHGVGGHQHD
ncbi:peptidylprolyl isomerase [Simiduia sp. 21SJ11W-1]|uniref:FKBP-type peptidyl-prolyl cis-trans isomerase n=1 Tax=Simiduia sp. 21SJ11W-1 TaxID=2909669 RepID=UPI00209F2E2F|nr:peptidylprolyl isomerase [Simiduia sp. 21SJ11W-1]UTA46971.1 peptidylprolyl isomerase [Simiduia sp. 21SJ11W-1]